MNKKILWFSVLIIALVVGFFIYSGNKTDSVSVVSASSPKDATYKIDGQPVTLVSGKSVVASAPGSATSVTTEYFGNEVSHDFDKDGRMDTAFILTQNTGGSGTFYYVAVALNKEGGYVGSESLLLGDRIAPQTIEMSKNPKTPDVIVVNYADRKAGEAFTVAPSVGKSIWLKLDLQSMQFGEVAQNFEGEADTSKMSLTMKTWNWVSTTYNDGKTITPKTSKFTITFKADKTLSVTTDCNGMGGEYSASGSGIKFTNLFSTLMYCEGSQEAEFGKALNEVQSYFFTSKGELVFDLKMDSGTMTFK